MVEPGRFQVAAAMLHQGNRAAWVVVWLSTYFQYPDVTRQYHPVLAPLRGSSAISLALRRPIRSTFPNHFLYA